MFPKTTTDHHLNAVLSGSYVEEESAEVGGEETRPCVLGHAGTPQHPYPAEDLRFHVSA